jgi:dystroglycan 1
MLTSPPCQGKFQGLDLNEELYLGGYPDYGAIPKSGLSSGFVGEPLPTNQGQGSSGSWGGHFRVWVGAGRLPAPLPSLIPPARPPGCVRELRIQGEETVFHDLNLTAHGISHCPTCRDRPCQVAPHPHTAWLP